MIVHIPTPSVLQQLLHQLPRQHLGVQQTSKVLEAVGDLRLGVLQHVRRNLGSNVDALNRAVKARRQRRVVGVVCRTVKHMRLGRQEEDRCVQEEAAGLGGIVHPLPVVHHEELTPLLVLPQDVLPLSNLASAPLIQVS